MSGKTLGVVTVAVILLGGGWYFYASQNKGGAIPIEPAATASAGDITPPTDVTVNPQSQNVTVTYTDQGFSPQKVTIPLGATVTFVNNSTHRMWVATASHPTHDHYDDTTTSEHCANGVATTDTFDECRANQSGESWSYAFAKAGSWNYHNHSRASDFGSVVVTPPPTSVSESTEVTI